MMANSKLGQNVADSSFRHNISDSKLREQSQIGQDGGYIILRVNASC